MEITAKELNRIQKKISIRAVQLNRALGLPYYKVKNGILIAVDEHGNEKEIRKSVFGNRMVYRRRFKLKNGH